VEEPRQGEVRDWLLEEKGQNSLRSELQRLKRRAKARPIPVFVVAALLVGGVLYRRATRVPLYRAAVIIRVTENTLVNKETPLAAKNLDVYLNSVALTNDQLLKLVEKHDLYPLREVRGNQYAIMRMRQNMKMTLVDDYFGTAKRFDTVGRTARVTLYFQDADRDVAYTVAQDLANTLIANEQKRRETTSAQMTAIADAALERAEKRSLVLQGELTKKALQRRDARRRSASEDELMALGVEFQRVRTMLERANKIYNEAQEQKSSVDLILAADSANIGLRFEIVDVRSPPKHHRDGPLRMLMIGLGLFVVILPLSAIGIGAFDSRLHHTEDLMRLDIPVVGHVPAFPGSTVGSLEARTKKAKAIA
jgi:hypothetical protein